ncbi:hypothetical protein MIND_00430100 [Mycena indigotica]|uniref:Uncharacterized protein n=1 Tax=Mycena indigotica TaxID=2126181 RepID=A0A8H6W5C7_9AGAR|nr:uncharacterized protein MIND_00430100 [Mycena indigotica]KAF7306389.1 hypothetical protein MIND_00430100 [Mycena indigotica]
MSRKRSKLAEKQKQYQALRESVVKSIDEYRTLRNDDEYKGRPDFNATPDQYAARLPPELSDDESEPAAAHIDTLRRLQQHLGADIKLAMSSSEEINWKTREPPRPGLDGRPQVSNRIIPEAERSALYSMQAQTVATSSGYTPVAPPSRTQMPLHQYSPSYIPARESQEQPPPAPGNLTQRRRTPPPQPQNPQVTAASGSNQGASYVPITMDRRSHRMDDSTSSRDTFGNLILDPFRNPSGPPSIMSRASSESANHIHVSFNQPTSSSGAPSALQVARSQSDSTSYDPRESRGGPHSGNAQGARRYRQPNAQVPVMNAHLNQQPSSNPVPLGQYAQPASQYSSGPAYASASLPYNVQPPLPGQPYQPAMPGQSFPPYPQGLGQSLPPYTGPPISGQHPQVPGQSFPPYPGQFPQFPGPPAPVSGQPPSPYQTVVPGGPSPAYSTVQPGQPNDYGYPSSSGHGSGRRPPQSSNYRG